MRLFSVGDVDAALGISSHAIRHQIISAQVLHVDPDIFLPKFTEFIKFLPTKYVCENWNKAILQIFARLKTSRGDFITGDFDYRQRMFSFYSYMK